MTRALWGFGGAAAVLFVTMGVLSLLHLSPLGVMEGPLDMRLIGAAPQATERYLDAVFATGKEAWFDTLRWLDTVFLILFATFLGLVLWRFGPGWSWWLLFPLAYAVADGLENAQIAGLVADHALGFDAVSALGLRAATIAKFAALALSVLGIVALWRRGRS